MKGFLFVFFVSALFLCLNPDAHSEDNDKNKNAKENNDDKDQNKDQVTEITVQKKTGNSFVIPENNLNSLENAESIAYYYICTNLTKPEKISREEEREAKKLEKEIIKREKKAARKLRKEIDKGLTLQR